MNINVNAHLIFCEGPHDSSYVRMIMKNLMGFSVERLKFSEMPSPFHKLFETAVKKHAAQDMSLDMAHKFFLPDTVLRKENNIIFLFNCGGKTQYEKIRILLSSYIPLFSEATTFAHGASEVTQSVQYLFLYDADADGLESIIKNLNREFKTIDEENFIVDNWANTKSRFGKSTNDKAVFVWGFKPEQGTLEDILYPIFEFEDKHKDIMTKANESIHNMFHWDIENVDLTRSVAETERFKKAVLTTVGQRKKPGASLNVILEQSGLITNEALNSCNTTTSFISFMNEFLENPI